jgi:hypothetical protein
MSVLDRAQRTLRRHGVAGTARLAAAKLGALAYLDEQHIWYALELGGERPRRELPEGVALRQATPADLPLLEQLPTIPVSEARRRLAEGADCWLAVEGDTTAFACWIFHGGAPVLAAPGGRLDLPDGVVMLEDSITSPAFRGRSVAPGAWSAIADRLEAGGTRTILTKVEHDNMPVQRALEKAGYAQTARMHLRRIGPRARVSLVGLAPGAALLAERLGTAV